MLRVEHFLKLSQPLVEFLGLLTLVLTFTLKAGGVVGIDLVQVDLFSRVYPVPADVEIACQCEIVVFPRVLRRFRIVL